MLHLKRYPGKQPALQLVLQLLKSACRKLNSIVEPLPMNIVKKEPTSTVTTSLLALAEAMAL